MKSFTIAKNSIIAFAAFIQLCIATPIELSAHIWARQAAPSSAAQSIAFQTSTILFSSAEPSTAQHTMAQPTFAPIPSSQPTASSSSSTTYIVQAGDTFSYIAAKFGTSVAAIETANPALTANDLQIGAPVLIPRNFAARSVASTYIIQAGDTFGSIAAQLGTTVAALEGANPSLSPTDLQIGDEIVVPDDFTSPGNGTASGNSNSTLVPKSLAARSSASTYFVQAGDTFASIAAQLGTTVEALESANPSLIPTDLQISAEIIVPGDNTASGNGTASPIIVVPLNTTSPGNETAVKRQSMEEGISLLSLIRRLIFASP